jgi:hypothetical protein
MKTTSVYIADSEIAGYRRAFRISVAPFGERDDRQIFDR